MSTRTLSVIRIVGLLALLAATVMVFLFYDHRSHSASDTLRPFLLTMTPVWVAALLVSNRFGHLEN